MVETPTRDAPDLNGIGSVGVPLVSASASASDGEWNISLSNRHYQNAVEVELALRGAEFREAEIKSLEADAPNAENTADRPDRVAPAQRSLAPTAGKLTIMLPPCSVHTVRAR